jgi:hypothetical protein
MDERRKSMIRRRDLLLAATATGTAAALGAASMTPAPAKPRRDKRKPQYQGNSPEVQTFYRVNKYPVK